jgi:bacteriocin-like protein
MALMMQTAKPMQELDIEELNAVVGGTYGNGKPYAQSQVDYIRRVLGSGSQQAYVRRVLGSGSQQAYVRRVLGNHPRN